MMITQRESLGHGPGKATMSFSSPAALGCNQLQVRHKNMLHTFNQYVDSPSGCKPRVQLSLVVLFLNDQVLKRKFAI